MRIIYTLSGNKFDITTDNFPGTEMSQIADHAFFFSFE